MQRNKIQSYIIINKLIKDGMIKNIGYKTHPVYTLNK